MTNVVVKITSNTIVPVERITGWRGLHVAEGGRVPDPLGSPGVIPPYEPVVQLPMTESIQRMSYDLMAHFHAAVRDNPGKWRIMHGWNVAMCNRTGFDKPDDPRADFVNGADLKSPLPAYDKMQRTFAGSFITGQQIGGLIWCTPGVDAIDATKPMPPLSVILEKRWFSYAVAETSTGAYKIRGQWDVTDNDIIVFPFILDRAVSYEAAYFAAWDDAVYPEPLEIYLPKV